MNNKQQDKQMIEDQAFIDALYEDLSNESGAINEDQSSAQLDQRILAAAHKALEKSPEKQNVIQGFDQKTKKTKKTNWFYPLATAASAILMLTVVSHQIHSPLTEKWEMPLASQNSAPDIFQHQPSFSLNEITEMNEISEISSDFIEADFISEPQRLVQAKEAKRSKAKSNKTKQKLMKSESKKRAPMMQTQFSKESPRPLTTDEYSQLTKRAEQETLHWTLLEEFDSSYIIELQISKNNKAYYRLNKNDFLINEVSRNTPRLFTEIGRNIEAKTLLE